MYVMAFISCYFLSKSILCASVQSVGGQGSMEQCCNDMEPPAGGAVGQKKDYCQITKHCPGSHKEGRGGGQSE